MRSPSSCHARGVQSPLVSSSLVPPSVSNLAMSSNNRTTLVALNTESSMATSIDPDELMGAHGMTCFCPLSATASHHRPVFGAARNARTLCFSPLLALS